MTKRTRYDIAILAVLIVGIAGYAVWTLATGSKIKRLLAGMSEPPPESVRRLKNQAEYYKSVGLGPRAAPELLNYLEETRESRNVAAAALADMSPLGPEHLERLLGLAWDGDSFTRCNCLIAAAKINPQTTAKRFERILEDDLHSSTIARVHAAAALDAIGPVNDHARDLIDEAGQDPRLIPFMPRSHPPGPN